MSRSPCGRIELTHQALPTARKPRPSKHDDRVKIQATPEQVAKSLFSGKPKPRKEWRYLRGTLRAKS